MFRHLAFAAFVLMAGVVMAPLLRSGAVSSPVAAGSDSTGTRAVADARNPWSRAGSRPAPAVGEAMAIARDASGQFHLDADIGGETVRFLVDTGADTVALTMEDAERLGIAPDPDSLVPIAHTASGVGYGARVHLDRITIGGRDISDVDAIVMRGLEVNLLGQSALRRLGGVSLRGDHLLISPG